MVEQFILPDHPIGCDEIGGVRLTTGRHWPGGRFFDYLTVMDAANVVDLTTLLLSRGIDAWVAGGWGVDALLGSQTRAHDDLDISVRSEDEEATLNLLDDLEFEVITDWRPTRVALRHPTIGEVDVHPIHFEPDGSGWLPGPDGQRFVYPVGCFTIGTIAGAPVPCITAALQLDLHLGYEPTPKDRADMRALAGAGLVELPAPYQE